MEQMLSINAIPTAIQMALESIQVDEETGEITGMEALEQITEKASDKAAHTAMYLRFRKGYLEQMQALKKDLDQRISTEKKRLEWLKSALYASMKAIEKVEGVRKIERPEIVVSLRKTQASLVVDEEGAIPDEFWKVERSVKARDALAAIKTGRVIPGCHAEAGETVTFK